MWNGQQTNEALKWVLLGMMRNMQGQGRWKKKTDRRTEDSSLTNGLIQNKGKKWKKGKDQRSTIGLRLAEPSVFRGILPLILSLSVSVPISVFVSASASVSVSLSQSLSQPLFLLQSTSRSLSLCLSLSPFAHIHAWETIMMIMMIMSCVPTMIVLRS